MAFSAALPAQGVRVPSSLHLGFHINNCLLEARCISAFGFSSDDGLFSYRKASGFFPMFKQVALVRRFANVSLTLIDFSLTQTTLLQVCRH